MKNQFCVMINRSNSALLIIKDSHPDKPDYLANGFEVLGNGTRRQVEVLIEQFWEDENVHAEMQIVSEVN